MIYKTLAVALTMASSLILAEASACAGDIYTLNAYLDPGCTHEKIVILDKGDYIAYADVLDGDVTKVELEAELVRAGLHKELVKTRLCPANRLTVGFSVGTDMTQYVVRVHNKSSDQVEIRVKLKTN